MVVTTKVATRITTTIIDGFANANSTTTITSNNVVAATVLESL